MRRREEERGGEEDGRKMKERRGREGGNSIRVLLPKPSAPWAALGRGLSVACHEVATALLTGNRAT